MNVEDSNLYLDSGNVLSINNYNQYGTPVVKHQPDIVKTIQGLDLPVDIIGKAIEIFYEISNTRTVKSFKNDRKLRLIFYCIFMGYYELGHMVDPYYVTNLINMSKNRIDKALFEYSDEGVILFNPEDLVEFFINQFNQVIVHHKIYYDVQEVVIGVKEILKVCRSTESGKEWIENSSVRSVTISTLYFYLTDILGINMKNQITLFEKACNLSYACIRRYCEQVSMYYNNN